MSEYKVIEVDKLQPFLMRGLRESVLSKLKERIQEGFNPARPLTVIQRNGHYVVADGNHRLKVLTELGINEVPVIISEGDPYTLAVKANGDEDTYAPMDLFDWLDIIKALKADKSLTQELIGERIGWSRGQISNYLVLIDNIATNILDYCREHQEGRVAENATNVATHNFTEGWFRNSGLYDINGRYQERLIHEFKNDKFNWNKDKVQRESRKYKLWQDFIGVAENELVNRNDIDIITKLVENDSFRNEAQLRQKINDLNQAAENKLICGDSVIELEKLPDASIDLVITDPPYGIEYYSNRSEYNNHVTKDGVFNDNENALKLVNDICLILSTKTKQDAHLYFFSAWGVYHEFKKNIENYFDIKNIIIWDKGNHGSGDLQGSWGNQYEMIIFATKGNRPVNKRRGDIVTIQKVNTAQMIHPTQKPVDLITELLTVSAQNSDTVCDPFMGSGSTIKAVKQYGHNLKYIGIEINREMYEKARANIG